jgi:hypothetical protein
MGIRIRTTPHIFVRSLRCKWATRSLCRISPQKADVAGRGPGFARNRRCANRKLIGAVNSACRKCSLGWCQSWQSGAGIWRDFVAYLSFLFLDGRVCGDCNPWLPPDPLFARDVGRGTANAEAGSHSTTLRAGFHSAERRFVQNDTSVGRGWELWRVGSQDDRSQGRAGIGRDFVAYLIFLFLGGGVCGD